MPDKTLYLLRHAKSSWDNPGLGDRERPLNKRGKHDAPRMAERLAEKSPHPQYIITSPAVRARETAEVFARELDIAPSDFVINEAIYGAGAGDLADIIRLLDDELDCVMLVGHNPDLTWLANELAAAEIDNIPTCGIVTLNIESGSWQDTGVARTRLVDFDYPKKISD